MLDDILDNDRALKLDDFLIINTCQEEAILILSSIFESTSVFWKFWHLRKNEYLRAFQIEKVDVLDYNQVSFRQLSDFKSAFGKVVIDALNIILNFSVDVYDSLLESHRSFYFSFQILDDIKDIEQDYQSKQYNYALNKLMVKGFSLKTLNKTGFKKILYQDETVLKLYDEAFHELFKAYNNIKSFNYKYWNSELEKLINTVIVHKLNIVGFKNVYLANYSNLDIECNTNKKSIKLATKFLKKASNNGVFTDFFNSAGLSDVWVSSFLAYFTSKSQILDLNDTLKFINNQYIDGKGWGYNKSWITDADTTTFSILALYENNFEITNDMFKCWLKYQNEDGGFATYKDEGELLLSLNNTDSNISGWMASHFCVSSAAYLLFSQLNIKSSSDEFINLRRYILNKIDKNHFDSYWWDSPIYSLSLLIIGSKKINDLVIYNKCLKKLNDILDEGLDKIKNFYLGLSLLALKGSSNLQCKNIINKLIKSQKNDGSWSEDYILRMPSPEITNPDDNNILWQNKKTFGTNIIVRDHNRLFSTALPIIGIISHE
jgi:hypothetical protein